jgi:hypothetical protein
MSRLRDVDVESGASVDEMSDPASPAVKDGPGESAAFTPDDEVGENAMRKVRRIAEEEVILVLLLAGFGAIFLLIFPPSLLVNDSWMTLVAGREIVQHGLPHHDTLTVMGLGRTWTDQQWGAHLLFYGLYALGGHGLLAVVDALVVVTAFSLAVAGARSLGAGPRSIWALFLPVLLAAPWAWTIRAQLLALPLYTGLLWLLATEARRPTRRVYLAFPILLVWANLHGSAALGAMLTMLLGLAGLATGRGRTVLRTVLLLVVPPLAVLATPYGPVATARYYDLLLVNPPFDHNVTEWMWSKPAAGTVVFYLLAAAAIPLVVWGRKRLSLFDVAVLALTFFGAVTAIRGIPWFALACMLFLPVAIGRALESRHPAPVRRRLNTALAAASAIALVGVVVASLLRDPSWYEKDWAPQPVAAVRSSLQPTTRVFAADVFSDWLLWKIPELRGRVAYDIRFEIYPRSFFHRLLDYNYERGQNWKAFANGYPIVLVDEHERSHTADFLAEPGARKIFHNDDVTVILRPQAK